MPIPCEHRLFLQFLTARSSDRYKKPLVVYSVNISYAADARGRRAFVVSRSVFVLSLLIMSTLRAKDCYRRVCRRANERREVDPHADRTDDERGLRGAGRSHVSSATDRLAYRNTGLFVGLGDRSVDHPRTLIHRVVRIGNLPDSPLP